MISRTVRQRTGAIYVEKIYLGSAAAVAVADDDDRVARHEHFVIPIVARIYSRSKRIYRRDRRKRIVADLFRKEPPAAKNNEVFAVQLYNAAFVNSGVLRVRDRFLFVG